MSNIKETCLTLERYFKARIPFISIRTPERGRMLELVRSSAQKVGIPVYVHTLSQGIRDIVSNRQVCDERSVPGALDYISQQIVQRENLTFVLTEVTDIDNDTPTARLFLDLLILAVEHSAVIAVITNQSVWSPLQRMGMSISLDSPDEDEMLQIITEQIDPYRNRIKMEWDQADERRAAAILTGITRIEAENVIATLLANGCILKKDLEELTKAKDRIFADISGLERVFQDQNIQVGGLEGLKMWLNDERSLLTADLRDRGIRPPRGLLLVGVPGCGKSLSAKQIANSWGLPLYRLDLSTIHGQYLGQSESRLKEALSTADHVAPCVLWIDEIEKGLAGAGSSSDGGTSTRLVGQFLYWLQESKTRVFVVATANDVSMLPPELLRRGRFDELFFVDLPTREERRQILDIYIHRGLKRGIGESLMEELIDLTTDFSGADIESSIREVVKFAFRNGDEAVTDEIFRRSINNVVPLSKTSPEQIESIRNWGRERAVPASGNQIPGTVGDKPRRSVLVH
ncbi:MAG: AAA family ATPase [Candidatus Cloacimonadota bacterium]